LRQKFSKVRSLLDVSHGTAERLRVGGLFILIFLSSSTGLHAATPQVTVKRGDAVIDVEAVTPNIVRIDVKPSGATSPRTEVMDPSFQPTNSETIHLVGNTLTSPEMSVLVSDEPSPSVQVKDSQGHALLTVRDLIKQAGGGNIEFLRGEDEPLYGMRGLTRDIKNAANASILRGGNTTISMGSQGDGGAPFFFSKSFGVLVDSDGGEFEQNGKTVYFHRDSRHDVEFFVIIGGPLKTMSGLSLLTGRAPMPPRWTLGFLNSQYGSTEKELRDIADTYRQRNIPVSAFILDFDWKAWGEDHYGEWRWNSTSGPGNGAPDKFPNGASGKFSSDMRQEGIHLAGILKPRILVEQPDGRPTEASAYATAHNFWYPNEVRNKDYVTHRLAGNIDFANPEARKWFWDHLIPSFKAGMTGWWNDEADREGGFQFNNFQFLNMGRALYDGQRSMSEERVWSINRAYYLGALRYGFALWSGDVVTGFPSMAYQKTRMVSALNTGMPLWSMDTGGFIGHPTPENYARWAEFATFVPIDRVHGGHNEKRQPWVYGPIAEAAAKRAIRLRYDLLPYIYSNQRICTDTGIGIVQPLFWVFPDDQKLATETRAWMFGDALLASPVVALGETTHDFYLPDGGWFDYWSGKFIDGGKEMHIPVDATAWTDMPLYIRQGSIVATQPSKEGNDLNPKVPLEMDIFPSPLRTAKFLVYDDDGHTYAYEKSDYFEQNIAAKQNGAAVELDIDPSKGRYKTTIPAYMMRVHTSAARVESSLKLRKFVDEAHFNTSSEAGWVTSHDRFGSAVLIRLAPGDLNQGTIEIK
jgi:alpha-glucosidase